MKNTLVIVLLITSSAVLAEGATKTTHALNPEIGVGFYKLNLNASQDKTLRQVAPTQYGGAQIWGQITPFRNIIGNADLSLRLSYFRNSEVNHARLCVWNKKNCVRANADLSFNMWSIDTLLEIPMTSSVSGIIGMGITRASYDASASAFINEDELASYQRSGGGVGVPIIFGIRLNDKHSPITLNIEHKRFTFEDRDNSYKTTLMVGYKL